MTTTILSRPLRSRQGIAMRVDYFFDRGNTDEVFYAGVYIEGHRVILSAKSLVVSELTIVDPTAPRTITTALKFFYSKGDVNTFAAPISGLIPKRFPAQLAVSIDAVWQEDEWQVGPQARHFNFTWIA